MKIVSQEEAKAAGDKYFFTGKPCRKGHLVERFTSCNQCTECSRLKSLRWYSDKSRAAAKARKWRAENPERETENRRAWQSKNRDKVKEQSRQWHARNPDARKEINRRQYEKNKEKNRAKSLAYLHAHKEERRAYMLEYNKNNLPKLAVHARNRRARQRSGGTHTIAEIAEIMKMQKGKCGYAGLGWAKCITSTT